MKKLEFSAALCVFFVIIAIFVSISVINPANSRAAAFNPDKNYGAYIIKKDVILRLNKNYGLKTYITESVKILSQRGINKYSEVIVPFSTKYQKIKLLYAYTLLKGIFKVPAGKHAVNVVSPGFAVNYPAYSDIKYLTVSMPAVEEGSIINFSYEVDNFKPLIKNGVFYTNYFSYTIPAKKVILTLTYPAGLSLNLYLHKLNKSIVSKRTVYIKNQKYFKLAAYLENIPAIKKESYMPPVKNLRKYIAVSTYASWSNLLKKINMMFVKSEKSSEKIEKFVKSAVKKGGGKSQKQKAVSIYNDFVKSFRYEGIGYGANGYNPEPAGTTFGYGYGDSKSLASLLISMLKIEKINAYPVLISSLNTADLNIKNVSPKQFDSVIVGLALKEKGKTVRYYLYPDSSSYKAFKIPFSLAGRKGVLLLNGGGFKFITLPSEKPEQNEKIFKFKGKLNKNGDLKGAISVVYKGVYSNFERSSLKNIDNYNKKNKISNFLYDFLPGAYVKNFKYENINNVNKNIKLKIKFSDKNYGVLKGDKLVFHSVIPIDMSLIHLVLKQKRLYPLIIGYPFEHISEIKIKLPEKSDIYYLPDSLKFSNKADSAYSGCSFSKNKETLKCFYKFKSKTPAVSDRDYKKYRQIIRNYLEYLKNYFIAVSSVYFY
ncbi:MAG: DUF3857 domain-containing protein [bacterium]